MSTQELKRTSSPESAEYYRLIHEALELAGDYDMSQPPYGYLKGIYKVER